MISVMINMVRDSSRVDAEKGRHASILLGGDQAISEQKKQFTFGFYCLDNYDSLFFIC